MSLLNCTQLHFASVALLALAPTTVAQQIDQAVAIGPYAGTVHEVAVDPLSPHELFIGSGNTAGFIRTDGEGVFSVSNAAENMSILEAIVPDLDQPGRLLAGSGTGVFESLDNGATWIKVLGMPAGAYDLAPAPDGQTWLAGTVLDVYRSTDDGQTWQLLETDLLFSPVAWSPIQAGVGYYGTKAGLKKTTDGGVTFTNPGTDTTEIRKLCVDPTTPDVIWIGTCCGDLKRSTDGGVTFADLTIPIDPTVPISVGSVIRFIEADPLVHGRIWLGVGRGVYTSDDGGQTWVATDAGVPFGPTSTAVPLALAFAPDGTRYLGTTIAGLYRMLPGASEWMQIGMPALTVTGVFVTEPGGKRVAWNSNDVFVSDGIKSVLSKTLPPGPANTVKGTWVALADRTDPGRWLFGGSDDFIFAGRITVLGDFGQSIVSSKLFVDNGPVSDLVQDPQDPTRFLAAIHASPEQYGVAVSTNSGLTWVGLPNSTSINLSSLDIDPNDSSHWFATGTVFGDPVATLFETDDNGQTIAAISVLPGNPPLGSLPGSLRFDPFDSEILYYTSKVGLFRSDDSAATWNLLDGEAPINQLAFHPSIPGLLWYGNTLGDLRLSGDRGTSFSSVWTTPFGGSLNGLAFDPQSDTIVAGAFAESAFEVAGVNPIADLGGGTGASLIPIGGLPSVGNAGFGLAVGELMPSLPVVLLVGLTDPDLPLLGGTIHTGPPFALQVAGTTDALGQYARALPIPPNQALIGLEVFAQAFGIDAATAGGLTFSNGLAIRLFP